jgi:hypothetical protein
VGVSVLQLHLWIISLHRELCGQVAIVLRGVGLPHAFNEALNEQYCGFGAPSINIIEFVSLVEVVF